MNTTINSTTIEPGNESDNTIGLIVTLVEVSPILLGGLGLLCYMFYFYELKPWYKKIKNRIKTYCIWFLRKVRYIINSCYESSIVNNIRNNNRNNNENSEIIRRERELDIIENGGKIKKLSKQEIEVLEINDMCPICYDEIKNKNKISQLKCGHIFHQECISEWTKKCKDGNNCPVCRSIIENDMFVI